MQDTDHKQAFNARVAKIKQRSRPVRDSTAGLIQDEPREPAKQKSGTPTLLRMFALALAVSSLLINHAPEKFGLESFLGENPTQAKASTSQQITGALAANG